MYQSREKKIQTKYSTEHTSRPGEEDEREKKQQSKLKW